MLKTTLRIDYLQCKSLAVSALSLLLTYPIFSYADEYHYNDILIGDRASGMAGAYVAIADDPSGLYYNPAGTVYSGSTSLSASMNAVNFTRTKYKDVLGDNKDWVRTSSALIPNYFGVTQPLGPGTVGFSYAVTDSVLEDQDQTFPGVPNPSAEYTINFNNQDSTYNIGPSYALPIGSKFAVGITLYGYIRQRELIFNQLFKGLSDPVYTLDGDGKRIPDASNEYGYQVETDPNTGAVLSKETEQWENQYLQVEEYGVRPLLGFMWSPVEKLSLGASFSKTQLLYASNTQQVTCYSTDYDGVSLDQNDNPTGTCRLGESSKSTSETNLKRDFPWAVNLGAAYFANERLILSAASWIYQGMNGQNKPLINVAAGLEYYISGRFAIRLGGFSNKANTPDLEENRINQAENVDFYGGSFSITHFTRSSSISLGVNGSIGRGEAQVISNNPNIQRIEALSIAGFMSAAYSY